MLRNCLKSSLALIVFLLIFSSLEAQEAIFRINTGGTETTYNNKTFTADAYAEAGSTLDRPQTGLPEPFKSFRFSRSQQMSYEIPILDGEYTVKLYFAELWFGATGGGSGGVGSRVFDVILEGQLAEDNLDVFAEVGADAMLMKSHVVTVSGGTLNIDFDSRDIVGGERHPIINAIEIVSNPTVIPDITIDPIPDQSNTINETISLAPIATGGDMATSFNFTISGQPEGIQINQNTGLISGVIGANAANDGLNNNGIYQVTVSASKTGSSDASVSFQWTITDLTCVWNPLADANIDRFEAISQKIGDKLYVLGGFKPGVLVVPETEIYDTTNDVWSIGASMPIPVTHTAAVAVGTDIWILGGFAGNNPGVATNAVQVYNTLTDSWSTGPDLPNPIGSAAGALSGTKIHFFGGLLPDRQTDVADHLVLDLTNIAAGWTSAAPMPNARNHHSGISVNGIIFAIGGQIGHDGPKQDTQFVHSYDPNTDTWTRRADLARTRSHFKAATTIHNGKIIIVGGIDNGPIVNDISVYDPQLNVWSELCKLPGEGLEEAAAQAFGDRLIVSGGRPLRDSNVIIKETKWLQLDADTSQPPVANAGEDQTITLPTNEVTLTGSGVDPDGGAVTYLWSQESGPSTADISDVSLSDLTTSNLAEGTYVFRLTVTDDENESSFDEVSIVVNTEIILPDFAVRINTGGPEIVWSGDTFIADQYRTGGLVYSVDFPINNTTNDELYQTEIFGPAVGPFSYEIPVPDNGTYDIRLHFAELYFGIQAGGLGSRVFNVSIEGNEVLANFDILSEVAPATALIKEFNNVRINDGFATIEFTGVTQRAKISGVEVLGQGNTETDIPVITLIGDEIINLELGDTYTELGATAIDNSDGDLSTSIIIAGDLINTNSVGTYIVTYDVSDSDNNSAERLIRTVNVKDSSAQNNPDANVNLALLNDAVLSGTDGSRGSLEAILYDPVSDDYFVKTAYNEYGVGYLENLGRPDADNGFEWRVDWSSAKLINYITFGGVYPNQPQPNTAWRISYLNNGNWTVIEEGQGGWIDSGIFEWGGSMQLPISADALRVQIYSDGGNDLVSIHLRGRGGTSNNINDSTTATKATLIQYVPTELEERPFVTTWKTDNPGVSEDNQITIPTHPNENYNYTVDWGDGNFDTGITGDVTHTYTTAGTYQVSISGDFPRIYFNGGNDGDKIVQLNQWGATIWSSMEASFDGCNNLDVIANDTPNFSNVTSLKQMFSQCLSLKGNENFNNWNVSSITDMSNLFAGAKSFNQPIGNWDVGSVTDMSGLFADAFEFNQPIGNWNVSNVRNMDYMLFFASKFNKDLSLWDVSKVTSMVAMFESTSFNQPIGNWNVSNVRDMIFMFVFTPFDQDISNWNVGSVERMDSMFQASSFNQNISTWNVSSVIEMDGMFNGTPFNQNLGSWNISSALNMANMFDGTELSLENYDSTLVGWSTQQLQNGVVFSAANSQYCQGEQARQKLIDDFGWVITDGGKNIDCFEVDPSISDLTIKGGVQFQEEIIIEDGLRFANDGSGSFPAINIGAMASQSVSKVNFRFTEINSNFMYEHTDSQFPFDTDTSEFGQNIGIPVSTGIYILEVTPFSSSGVAGEKYIIQYETYNSCLENIDQIIIETIDATCNTSSDGSAFINRDSPADVLPTGFVYDPQIDKYRRDNLLPGDYSVYIDRSPNCGKFLNYSIGSLDVDCQEPNTDDIWLEAECAIVGSNWSFVSDSSASNGEYVLPPAGFSSSGSDNADNIVRFDFNATADTYNIYALVKTPNTLDDSFYIRVNGGLWRRWNNIPQVNSFQWNQIHDRELVSVPLSFNLFDGINTLEIANREDGAGLDKIYITKSDNVPSGSGLADTSCSSNLSGRNFVANPSVLSPNPVINTTSLSFEKPVQLTAIQVYDITGRLVHTYDGTKTEDQGSYILNVATLPAGTYFLKSQDTKGQSHQKQMVIKE